ncbi:hypothetical protein AGMMS49944_26140 [Spirochaetia bacterium]|nr:hypothetical protein AGMMS49944_26140 [Spirochaetia bacterium]
MNRELKEVIENMPIEEKLALLPDTDKAYLRGYLGRALFEARRTQDGNHIKEERKKTHEQAQNHYRSRITGPAPKPPRPGSPNLGTEP